MRLVNKLGLRGKKLVYNRVEVKSAKLNYNNHLNCDGPDDLNEV